MHFVLKTLEIQIWKIYAYIDIAFNAKKMEIRELENLKVLEGKFQRMKSIEII